MIDTLIAEYLQELKLTGKSTKTVEAYGFHLEKFARFCKENGFDHRQVNGKESRRFRNWLAEQGLKPRSINAIISAVKSFYDFLVEEGEVKGNPIIQKGCGLLKRRGCRDSSQRRRRNDCWLISVSCHITSASPFGRCWLAASE